MRSRPAQSRLVFLSLALSLAVVGLTRIRVAAQQDYSDQLPRIPATHPADALATFTIADGFAMQQVAAEPLVTSPVAIEWDADGRMYVCEMRGYSEDRDDAISRITRLEDTNDDGIYDTSIVFADKLLWPTAIFPFDGGLFVGDAPNVYYFKDTDADGKADVKKTVLTGFGTSNVQGLLNSFRWGLDNRIHVACSSVGGMVRRIEDDRASAINVRGRDISFDPTDGTITLTSGGAQHGMCFDDWGRKFVSSNSDHIQQVMYEDRYLGRNQYAVAPASRMSIAADGPQAEVYRTSPVEPWRIVRTRLRVSGKVRGPIEGGGRAAGYFTGATGITIYRGDAWPSDWRGVAVVGDVGSNLIHRKRLHANGIRFIARRIDPKSEFVSSSDIWFRPAQFANGPDGSLHVIDVCREVIEHPASLPPEIKQHLDLTAGRDRGRIYRIIPSGFEHRSTPRLSGAPSGDLVKLLAHPNAWHRETAARLLFQRQDRSVVADLRRMVRASPSPLARMHSMYVLDGLGNLDAETVAAGLGDEHAQVRRHAIRLAELLSDPGDLCGSLTQLAGDDSVEVRYQLAFSIGSIDCSRRNEILAKLLRSDGGDPFFQAAIQSSLSQEASEFFADLVRDPNFRSASSSQFLQKLAAQLSKTISDDEARTSLAAIDRLPLTDSAFALPIIGELIRSRSQNGTAFSKLDRFGELRAIDVIVDRMVGASAQRALNESADSATRIAAIQSLAFGKFDDVREPLVSLIDIRQPAIVQRAAMTTLGSFDSPHVGKPILAAWPTLSPKLRETASEVLFARPERVMALFDAVDAGQLAITDIARSRLQVAANSKDSGVKSRASKLMQAAGSKRRGDVVDSYREALNLEGEVGRGKALFQKHCSGCHKVEGLGHEIGPNLATMKSRGAETILVNVLDPNREVNPQYLNYVLLTVDGRTITGMIAAESATGVTLRRAESEADTVLRIDIEQLKSTGLSIMPEGMEDAIDKQALADVIAYLMQVK